MEPTRRRANQKESQPEGEPTRRRANQKESQSEGEPTRRRANQKESQPEGEPTRRRANQKESQSEGEPTRRRANQKKFQTPPPRDTSHLQSLYSLFAPVATVNNAIDHMTDQHMFSKAHVMRKNGEDFVVQNCSQGELTLTGGQLTRSHTWFSSRKSCLCGAKRKGGNLQPTLRSRPRTLPPIPAWSGE